MKSVVAIRHVSFEDLGVLEPILRELGYEVQYVEAATDDLASLDPLQPALLVCLGGPIGAFDDETYPFVVDELSLVRRRLQAKLPTLGICLGAQLMARALGARVYSMGEKEIGFGPLKLTAAGRRSPLSRMTNTDVLHWHGDQFDIPVGAINLAGTALCPTQAFSVGTYALALQFHAEVDVRLLERWLVGHASELTQARIDPRKLREDAAGCRDALAHAAKDVFRVWLGATQIEDRHSDA